jgi:hypothetical protein
MVRGAVGVDVAVGVAAPPVAVTSVSEGIEK